MLSNKGTMFAICRGLSSRYMHPHQQKGMKDFPIAVISAENLDDLVSVLGGVKISSFEDEHEIFLSRDLFSRIGKHDSDENVVYIELGAARLALEPKEEGITLWVKEVPVLERGLVLRT